MATSKLFTLLVPSFLRNSQNIVLITPLKLNKILLPSLPSHRYCSSALAVDSGASPISTDGQSVISAHPWPEWVNFVDSLKAKGYFSKNPPQLEVGATISENEDSVVDEGAAVYTDMKLAKEACLSFARDRFDIFNKLSTQDIQAIVEKGCPNLFRKAVNSAKRLRAHIQLDEGSVCSSCNLRGSCDKAYVILSDSEEAARTVDIVRMLLHYALDPVVISGEQNPPGRELIEISARKLFSQMIDLGDTPPDPELPKPAAFTSRKKDQSWNFSESHNTNNIEMKQGDWNCTKCNFMNFARNIRCLKCKAEGPNKTSGDGIVEKKKGDWNCPQCSFMNFASNRQCFRCQEPRPQRQLKLGDWECPDCDFLNFSRNTVCKKCNLRRPQEVTVQGDEQTWRRPY